MSNRHRRGPHVLAAWLVCLAAPAVGQIGLIRSSGEILAGQSSSESSSTTIASQGQIFLEPAQTSATMRVGFNINADAAPGLVAAEIGLASFDLRFALDHAASFDLAFDFFLHGQLLRVRDQECQGSVTFGDIAIPSLVRLRDGAEFPLGVTLPGASLEIDGTDASFNFAEQDQRVIEVRGDPVETTAYRLNFLVSVVAISQSCEVSARFGADNGSTTGCDACVYPGVGDRVRDDDGLFVTVTVNPLCGNERLDAGEECDFGAANGTDVSCCDAFCRIAAGAPCTADRSACTDDVCDASGGCTHPLRAGTTCEQGLCTCDDDGLFCTGPAQCPADGGLCVQLPPPCGEDDTCDEEHDVCVTFLGTATVTATPTSSPTQTPLPAVTSTETPNAAICAGDCNSDHTVVVNELILGVNIALGKRPAAACASFDRDGNGMVVVSELIAAVVNALAGCPS